MRYSIHGFSQQKATDLGLDNDDLLILRWLVDFSATGQMSFVKENGVLHYWVNYKTLSTDLPILKMKKDTVYRRMKKMCNCNVLIHITITKGGTYSYYGFGEKYKNLIGSDLNPIGSDENPKGTDLNPEGVRIKIPNKDSSINNKSINNRNTLVISKKITTPYQSIIDSFHSICLKLPRVNLLNDNRKKRLRTIYMNEANQDLTFFNNLFEVVSKSDFLNGNNTNNWTSTFDWILKPANMVKILEGNYNNKKSNKTNVNVEQHNFKQRKVEDDEFDKYYS